MKALTWHRIAKSFCVLAAALVTAAFGADDASTSLTPRMTQTRAIIDGMLDPRGVQSMTLAPDGRHLAAIVWNGYANSLMLIDADTSAARVLVAPEYRSGWSGR